MDPDNILHTIVLAAGAVCALSLATFVFTLVYVIISRGVLSACS